MDAGFANALSGIQEIVALPSKTQWAYKNKMVSLKLQKRLAAAVLGCGKKKVWLDPNEINDISMANSRTPTPPLHEHAFFVSVPTFSTSRFTDHRPGNSQVDQDQLRP